jgi:hypothetical protein
VNDALALAAVLLLLLSGYVAGRVHAEVGYRTGFRMGYRQGHADGARLRPPPPRPEAAATIEVGGADVSTRSESRHNTEGHASVSSK